MYGIFVEKFLAFPPQKKIKKLKIVVHAEAVDPKLVSCVQ